MRTSGINHVSVHANDLDESVRFYVELLDAVLLDTPNFGLPVQWLGLGDTQLHLFEREAEPQSHHHFGITVEDLEPVYRRAEAMGAFDRDSYRNHLIELPGDVAQTYVRDPAGNLMEIDTPGRLAAAGGAAGADEAARRALPAGRGQPPRAAVRRRTRRRQLAPTRAALARPLRRGAGALARARVPDGAGPAARRAGRRRRGPVLRHAADAGRRSARDDRRARRRVRRARRGPGDRVAMQLQNMPQFAARAWWRRGRWARPSCRSTRCSRRASGPCCWRTPARAC